jgi:uncharacterized protein (TIGR02246 family)
MEKVMHKKLILAMVVCVSMRVVSALAQEPSVNSADERTIRKSAEEYCSAFNNGDVEALSAYWANDADYVDADGDTHRGKEAILALFKASAEDLKGHRFALKIDSVRFLKPEVAIEDGTASLTSPDGETTDGRYTAVWVKNRDQWLLNSVRELPADEDEITTSESNAEYLEPLAWLVGDWVSEDGGPAVNLTAKWALDKNFLVQDYTVAGKDGADLRVTQWIGVDPSTGQIKSWTFDSLGGYGEGLWTRDGNTWSVDTTGVLPDGRIGTALNNVRFVDETHFEWHSLGRNVEGQPMPDADVRLVRSDSSEENESR